MRGKLWQAFYLISCYVDHLGGDHTTPSGSRVCGISYEQVSIGSHRGESMGMPLFPHVLDILVIYEMHEVVDDLLRRESNRCGVTSLHAQEAVASVSVARVDCELMKPPLRFLYVFKFCLGFVVGAFGTLLSGSDKL
jgi:hypothetical protein